MRVPADARPGKASIRFELPKDSGFASVPTDLPVELAVGDKVKAAENEK